MPDQRPVSNLNSALILHLAAAVDKHVFSYDEIFPTVGIERRKQSKRIVCRPAVSLEKITRSSSGVWYALFSSAVMRSASWESAHIYRCSAEPAETLLPLFK